MKKIKMSSGNKKKDIIIILILLICLCGFGIYSFFTYNNNKPESPKIADSWKTASDYKSIVIKQYVTGTDTILRETSSNDPSLFVPYLDKIEELSSDEAINLAIAREIEFTYESYLTIQFQLNEKNYCYVQDQNIGREYMAKLPPELYDLIVSEIEKVEKKDVSDVTPDDSTVQKPIATKTTLQVFNGKGVLSRSVPISQDEIDSISSYISQLEFIDSSMEIKENVVLVYEGIYRIGINIDNSEYCNLINHNTGESGIAKIPYGLYQFILKKYNGS